MEEDWIRCKLVLVNVVEYEEVLFEKFNVELIYLDFN